MPRTRAICAMIVSSLLLAAVALPSALAQSLKTTAGPATRSNSVGILPPNPFPVTVTVTPPDPVPPDAGLYTTYTIWGGYTSLHWVECGSTAQAEGCFGSGSLGSFGKIGSMLEDNEVVGPGNTVTRMVYIVDQAVNGGTGVKLFVYQKTDVLTASSVTTTFNLINTISLPLTGGTWATTYMAGNKNFLFIGTNQGMNAVEVQKNNLAFGLVGGFSPPINVSSITANKYGFVAVTYGTSNASSGFYLFDINGRVVEDGGGGDFILDTINGVSTVGGNVMSAATGPNLAGGTSTVGGSTTSAATGASLAGGMSTAGGSTMSAAARANLAGRVQVRPKTVTP